MAIKTSMTWGDTGKISIIKMPMIKKAKAKSLDLEIEERDFSPPRKRVILSK
jgi:hypothetical protein